MMAQAYTPFMSMGTVRPDLGAYEDSVSDATILKDQAA